MNKDETKAKRPTKKAATSESARALVAVRWAQPDARSPEKRGGRPLSNAPRCPCGKYTEKMAALRCHYC